MKKYLLLVLLFGLFIQVRAQTIAITDVYGSSYCAGATFNIVFSITGTFSPNNAFDAQLSDGNGSFASPVTIGTHSSTFIEPIAVTIPYAALSGTGYRVRIVSHSPIVTSPDNGFNLTIHAVPTPKLTVSGNGCLGTDTLHLGVVGSFLQIDWYETGNHIPVDIVTTPSYQPSTVGGGNSQGNAANQLSDPNDVYVDASGNVYVADQLNDRIQQFPAGSTSATNATTVAGGNGQGNTAIQLFWPSSLYMDGNGNLYVADEVNNRVQQFPAGSTSATSGVTVAGGHGQGDNANQIVDPIGVYVDGTGNIYVADNTNNRIQKFPVGTTTGFTVAGDNGPGSAANQLNGPTGVFVDGEGNLYVADAGNDRIQQFPAGSTSATNGVTVAGGNGIGQAGNQLFNASKVYVDGGGNQYVADGDRVLKFPPGSTSATNGVRVAGNGSQGSGANQISQTYSTYVDANGSIYVPDGQNNFRIQKFDPVKPDNHYVPTAPGTYGGTYTSGAGCVSKISNAFTILPQPTPIITQVGNKLTTGIFTNYQWYKDGLPINGADGQALNLSQLSQGGSYNVVVIDTNGCPDTSAIVALNNVGIANVANDASIKLYPNPNNGQFMLETSNSIGNGFVVYNMAGKAVLQQTITADKQAVDMKGLPAATYTLQIRGSGHSPTRFTVTE